MAINVKFKRIILTVLFFSGLSVLHAQTAGYYLDPNSETPRFIQRLAWSGGTNSLHCEVIIEKEESGTFVNYNNKFTTDNFFEISLPPGNYRFRVIPYDILGKPSEGTEWAPFTVFNAVKPELYQPDELDYFNDRQKSQFEFNGNNIEPDATIYFVNSAGEQIFPTEVIRYSDGSGVRLIFDKGQLTDGEYEVCVVNPGGLETSIGGVDYKTYREKFGVARYLAGLSFMPSFQGYGDGFSSGGFLYFITARIGVISCIYLNNYIGMEFTVSRFAKNWDDTDYTSYGFTTEYNLLFVNWLPEQRASVNCKIGMGFDMQPMDLSYAVLGVSFLYRIYQNYNIEAGVNFTHIIKDGSGSIQPWIGLCVMF